MPEANPFHSLAVSIHPVLYGNYNGDPTAYSLTGIQLALTGRGASLSDRFSTLRESGSAVLEAHALACQTMLNAIFGTVQDTAPSISQVQEGLVAQDALAAALRFEENLAVCVSDMRSRGIAVSPKLVLPPDFLLDEIREALAADPFPA